MKAVVLIVALLTASPAWAEMYWCPFAPQTEAQADEFEATTVQDLRAALTLAFDESVYNNWVLETERQLAEIRPELGGKLYELPLTASDTWIAN